jgi:hypothetical protein
MTSAGNYTKKNLLMYENEHVRMYCSKQMLLQTIIKEVLLTKVFFRQNNVHVLYTYLFH